MQSSCTQTSARPEQIELTRLNSSRNMNSTNEDSSSSGKIDRVIVLTDRRGIDYMADAADIEIHSVPAASPSGPARS